MRGARARGAPSAQLRELGLRNQSRPGARILGLSSNNSLGADPAAYRLVAAYHATLANLTQRTRGELAVLDAGCGAGSFLQALVEAAPKAALRLYCLDPSTAMLSAARASLPAGTVFVNSHVRAPLPFPAAAFDAVFAVDSLHLLASDAEILHAYAELLRVVKPGGRVVVGLMPHPDRRGREIRHRRWRPSATGVPSRLPKPTRTRAKLLTARCADARGADGFPDVKLLWESPLAKVSPHCTYTYTHVCARPAAMPVPAAAAAFVAEGGSLTSLRMACVARAANLERSPRRWGLQLVADWLVSVGMQPAPDGGMVLGIVRHGARLGAPWDDDLDLLFDIESARRLLAEPGQGLLEGRGSRDVTSTTELGRMVRSMSRWRGADADAYAKRRRIHESVGSVALWVGLWVPNRTRTVAIANTSSLWRPGAARPPFTVCLSFLGVHTHNHIMAFLHLPCMLDAGGDGRLRAPMELVTDVFAPVCSGRAVPWVQRRPCTEDAPPSLLGQYGAPSPTRKRSRVLAALRTYLRKCLAHSRLARFDGVVLRVPRQREVLEAYLDMNYGTQWASTVLVCPHGRFRGISTCAQLARNTSLNATLAAAAALPECDVAGSRTHRPLVYSYSR